MGKLLSLSSMALVAILLSSCSGNSSADTDSNGFHLYRSPEDYVIEVPIGFSRSQLAPSGTYYYFGYSNNQTSGVSTVELHPLSQPCSPSTIGSSHVKQLPDANEGAEWGLVDVWDKFGEGDIPDWKHVVCKKDGTPPPTAVYALCTEKNGKTVMVCIDEITDNPTLAEQIFSSFRWMQ